MKGRHAGTPAHRFASAFALALALTSLSLPAADAPQTGAGEVQFRAAVTCPSTGLTQGACKGHVVDHIIPKACGGTEQVSNLQWLTLAEAKVKARWDRIGCRAGRKLVLPGEFTSTTEAFAIIEAPQPVQAQRLGPGPRIEKGTAPAPEVEPPEVREGGDGAVGDEPELPHQ